MQLFFTLAKRRSATQKTYENENYNIALFKCGTFMGKYMI